MLAAKMRLRREEFPLNLLPADGGRENHDAIRNGLAPTRLPFAGEVETKGARESTVKGTVVSIGEGDFTFESGGKEHKLTKGGILEQAVSVRQPPRKQLAAAERADPVSRFRRFRSVSMSPA